MSGRQIDHQIVPIHQLVSTGLDSKLPLKAYFYNYTQLQRETRFCRDRKKKCFAFSNWSEGILRSEKQIDCYLHLLSVGLDR